jgi:NTP pyrophosphatase (non-canonical NTP hydrolase)
VAAATKPRVVVCGTFHRAEDTLRRDFTALTEAGCNVLSPVTVDFVDEVDGFVLAAHEVDREPQEVERGHLRALQQADFVWLHAPLGYVGASATAELGIARFLEIPIFGRHPPADTTLRELFEVEVVGDVAEAIARASAYGTHTPSSPLDVLQHYYERVAAGRGYAGESAQDTMLMLTEEVGELARAVRRRVGLQRDGGYAHEDAAAELADLQLYVLHLANVLEVDLADAVRDKERVNARRHLAALAA